MEAVFRSPAEYAADALYPGEIQVPPGEAAGKDHDQKCTRLDRREGGQRSVGEGAGHRGPDQVGLVPSREDEEALRMDALSPGTVSRPPRSAANPLHKHTLATHGEYVRPAARQWS